MKTASMILFALIVLAIGLSSQTTAQQLDCNLPGATVTCVAPNQAPPAGAPHIIVYRVTDVTATSYAIPAGLAGVCIVTRNIAQSAGVDYTLVAPTGTTPGQITFTDPLTVGDVIQLNCW